MNRDETAILREDFDWSTPTKAKELPPAAVYQSSTPVDDETWDNQIAYFVVHDARAHPAARTKAGKFTRMAAMKYAATYFGCSLARVKKAVETYDKIRA